MSAELFINKKVWSTFDLDEMAEYKNNVFNYYRRKGFPYFNTSQDYRDNEFKKLRNFDYTTVLDNDTVRQTMHGLGLAWSYMPHAFSVRCAGLLSPAEVFYDDDYLRRAIDKRVRYGDNMSDSGLRKTLKIFSGAQAVSNFRPTAAAAIYKHFLPKGGVTWDMCGGYGGRLLGSILARVEYIATEPCHKTFYGLTKLANHYGKKTHIIESGSECVRMEKESIDLCFSSPPYYDQELYSTEKTQSYIKFHLYEDWLEGFLLETLLICHYTLKKGAHLVINIANTKKAPTLEDDFKLLAKKVGFVFCGELKLSLSRINGAGFKYEPVFVFKKG